MPEEPQKTVFVTFYSFKGGVGRSMALINTGGILAGRRGFRILVLDLDLEAPGLSYLDPNAPDEPVIAVQRELPLQSGFVDLMSDAIVRGQDADLFALPVEDLEAKYTKSIRIPNDLREFPGGSLHIMPAGRFDEGYAQRFDSLQLHELYARGLGEPLIRAFKQKIVESGRYDYVLVDSRTGFSDEAGICTRDLGDYLMIFSGLNRQNVEGTSQFLRALRIATAGQKTFQVILSPVPNGEDALFDKRESAAREAFQDAWGSEVDVSLQIPYHPQLALTEEPHIFRRHRGPLFQAYAAIETTMLKRLGHDAPTFRARIIRSLVRQDYIVALRELRHLIRLDRGQSALGNIVQELVFGGSRRKNSDSERDQEGVSFEPLLASEKSRSIVEFIVDNVPVAGENDSGSLRLLYVLWGVDRDLGDADRDLVDKLFKRLIDAKPKDANILGDYATFLVDECNNRDAAAAFYKRAIEVDPRHANNLCNYASFLDDEHDNLDAAETFYKRAIDAAPKHVGCLGNYANFLAFTRDDFDAAESFFKRALLIDPKHALNLCNYGQFLLTRGRVETASITLQRAFEFCDQAWIKDRAELCFCLWLVDRMLNQDAARWERQFKFLISQGFRRPQWSFDKVLHTAKARLSAEDFQYAKALAAAFLDENKVRELETNPRWMAIESSVTEPTQKSARKKAQPKLK